jgi:hypothetical protein
LKYGDIISYMLVSLIVGYTWTHEKYSDSPAMKKAVDMYTQQPRFEKRMFWNQSTAHRI